MHDFFYFNLSVNIVRRSWKYEKLMLLYGCNCNTEKRKVKIPEKTLSWVLQSSYVTRPRSTKCVGT